MMLGVSDGGGGGGGGGGTLSASAWYEHMLAPDQSELWDAFVDAHVWGSGGRTADAAGSAASVTAKLREGDPDGSRLAVRLRHLTEYLAVRIAGPGGDGVVGPGEMERFGRQVGRAAGSL